MTAVSAGVSAPDANFLPEAVPTLQSFRQCMTLTSVFLEVGSDSVPTTTRRTPLMVAGLAGLAVAVASVGTAVAISGGGYTPKKQGCERGDDAHNRQNTKQPKG